MQWGRLLGIGTNKAIKLSKIWGKHRIMPKPRSYLIHREILSWAMLAMLALDLHWLIESHLAIRSVDTSWSILHCTQEKGLSYPFTSRGWHSFAPLVSCQLSSADSWIIWSNSLAKIFISVGQQALRQAFYRRLNAPDAANVYAA